MQLNNLHNTAMAFNLFLERKPVEKLQHMIPVERGAPVHTVAQENYELLSIVALVYFLFIVLILLFSFFQKLEVVKGTTEYSYFRDLAISVTGPSYPKLWLLGPVKFFFKYRILWRTLSLQFRLVI